MRHFLLPLLMMLSAPTLVVGGDLAQGREQAMAICQTCHGMDGIATTAMTPNLSGQQKDYLIIQLKAFREGLRQNPQMSLIANNLSDQDIENLSEWYSSIQVTVIPP